MNREASHAPPPWSPLLPPLPWERAAGAAPVEPPGSGRNATQPRVSVIMAIRNEERFIAAALAAVRDQDYRSDWLEILVADGRSTDRTREIVRDLAARDPRIRLLDNPGLHVANGLNRALSEASGDIVVRVDGHCRIPPSYVRVCVGMLLDGRGDSVGGPVRAVGEGWVGRAIARAMSSPFGVGGAAFRWATDAREVEHLPFCALWRATIFRLGGFDEELVRNQDDEFSDRLRRAGGRIVLDPRIPVDYWSRRSFIGLWRQYYSYGLYKVRLIAKRGGRPASLRHLVPAAFVLALAGGIALGALGRLWWPLAVLLAAHVAFLLAGAATIATKGDGRGALLAPLAMAIMQLAYGLGFLEGVARACVKARPPRPREVARAA